MHHKLLFTKLTLPLAVTALAASVWASALENGQRTFASPREAAQAILAAAEAQDVSALSAIFGNGSDEILNSGDAEQDKNNLDRFVNRAKQSLQERVDPVNPNRASVLIGPDDFPFPIPLVRSAGRWHFDTPTGKVEILARRIGSNELDAIAACKAYVEAQYDYATEDRNNNGVPEYAHKLISSPGKRDGVFGSEADDPPAAFAEEVKRAQPEGYPEEGEKPVPYHGYYFRILTSQGPKAHGGALDYVQHGSMIGGFALVAWPAEHGVSGVKTFVVNQDGVIYEKDLGLTTGSDAEAMTAFDPDNTWRRVR